MCTVAFPLQLVSSWTTAVSASFLIIPSTWPMGQAQSVCAERMARASPREDTSKDPAKLSQTSPKLSLTPPLKSAAFLQAGRRAHQAVELQGETEMKPGCTSWLLSRNDPRKRFTFWKPGIFCFQKSQLQGALLAPGGGASIAVSKKPN